MSKPAHNDVLKCGYENYLIDNRDFRRGFIEVNLADFAEVVYAAGFEAGKKDEREACAAMLDQMAEEAEQDVVELLVKLQERCDELLKQRDELLNIAEDVIGMLENCSVESGVCHCGDDMARHSSAMSCGHAPVDIGSTYAAHLYEKARAAIASVKGGAE